MHSTEKIRHRLDYARFTHLAGMFMIAMWVYLFSTIPHKFWILLTVLVVSAGIEPGLIVRRAIHRVSGTFAALALLIPLLYLMQLNYRLISVVFILAIIGVAVSSLNPRRYNVSVFFTTIMIFLLLAETTPVRSPTGPFDMVMNRGICTLIGVAIVLMGDYFLFQGYHYSHKLYLFHQRTLYNFFTNTVKKIQHTPVDKVNHFLFVEKLRAELIEKGALIAISSENLLLEKKIRPQTKARVDQFQAIVWALHRLIFSLCVAKFILKNENSTQKQLEECWALLKKARANFIVIHRKA